MWNALWRSAGSDRATSDVPNAASSSAYGRERRAVSGGGGAPPAPPPPGTAAGRGGGGGAGERERDGVRQSEAHVPATHALALRRPNTTNATRSRTHGTRRRYAPTYQSGVTGWNDGSQPSGFRPRAASSIACGLSSYAVLSAA